MLPQSDALVTILTILYIVVLSLTYPLTIFPANSILENYTTEKLYPQHPSLRYGLKNFSRLIVCFIAAYCGIELAEVLDKVLALLGALGCAPLALLAPALCHLRLVARTKREQLEDIAIVLVSIVIMAFCVGETVSGW